MLELRHFSAFISNFFNRQFDGIRYNRSHKADTAAESKETNKSETPKETAKDTYIINKNTHKFHKPDCSSVKDMKPKNKKEFTGSRDELINQDMDPCDRCRP